MIDERKTVAKQVRTMDEMQTNQRYKLEFSWWSNIKIIELAENNAEIAMSKRLQESEVVTCHVKKKSFGKSEQLLPDGEGMVEIILQ